MKIIAVIEDTGERRLPVDGEVFTLQSCISSREAVGHLWTHHPSDTQEYAILRITEAPDLNVPMSVQEGAELIRLRAFHASVTKSLTLAAPALDDPDQLIGELKGLGSRLAFAGLQLSSALERLTISDPATGGDAPTEREIEGDGL